MYKGLQHIVEDKLEVISLANPKSLILRIPSFVDAIPKPYSLFNKIKISNESGRIHLAKDYSFNQEFLFGQDFYNVLLKILLNPKIKSQIFNISSSKSVNVMELLHPKFHYSCFPKNYSILDNAKILSYINFKFHFPKFAIEDNRIYWVKS